MSYRLHDDVSCCRFDGHFIFLDTRADRYFRLSSAMERAFALYVDSNDDAGIGALIERNILTPVLTTARHSFAVQVAKPTRSAMETSHAGSTSLATLLDVSAIACSVQWQLATHKLNQVLAKLSTYRKHRTSPPPVAMPDAHVQRLLCAARSFNRARVYVPIKPRCLPDAVAMVKFLAKRGLHANVIFGITSDPFAAHAWVQVADLVLSDSVGNVTAHTPIRVV